jgi:hypothetical protein
LPKGTADGEEAIAPYGEKAYPSLVPSRVMLQQKLQMMVSKKTLSHSSAPEE